jgi:tetratricopeptide (TPR) repeat protein
VNDFLQRPLHGPAIFNPDLLSKDELVRGFVARQELLNLFIEELQRVASGGDVQHHLVLGQRGMGKTTLLRRLRYAIDDDPALREAWLPLTFPEEQYDIAHLSDFYLNCIDALSDALEARGKAVAARALDSAVAAIPDQPEATRATRALDLLIRTAKQQKARLLLLLDNIDLLFHRLADHHWTLRELLSSEDRLCVIGTSAAAIETTYHYGKAFYDFFQIHMLGGLSEAECREVLLALSRLFNTPQVEQWIAREPARLKALRLLTGGNPRTVVLLHSVAASSAGGDVRSDLERLLDQCTPLYKHRFESLSDQAQRVVHALALHWQPASAAEIAEATRLDVNAASSQLARLVTDGVVEKVPFVPETKTGFQIAERFFNIWYLMRSSRRVRRRLVWLVEFLKMLYEGQELGAHARQALRGAPFERGHESAMRYAESALAFAEAVDEEPLKKALEGAAAHALTVLPELRDKIAAIVDLEGADAGLKPVLDRHRAAAEIREKVLSARVRFKGWNAEEFADLLGGSMSFSKDDKWRIANGLERLNESEVRETARHLQKESEWYNGELGTTVTALLRRGFQHGYLDDLDDCDAIDAAAIAMDAPLLRTYSMVHRCDTLRISIPTETLGALLPPDEMSYGWRIYGELLLNEGRRDGAEQAFRKARALGDLWGIASTQLGGLLSRDEGRLDEAEAAFRAAVAAPQAGSTQWKALAGFLARIRKEFEAAAEAYRQALVSEPGDASAWHALGDILLNDLSRAEEAEKAYAEATRIDGNTSLYWCNLGLALARLERWPEAETALRKATEFENGSALAWWRLGWVLARKGSFVEATGAFRHSTELGPNEGRAWNSLAWLLYLTEQDNDAESAAREAVRLDPGNLYAAHSAATILARRGHWAEAADQARRFLNEDSAALHTEIWEDIFLFFQEAVRSGHAAEAAALLDETDLGERWLPLREALRILAAGNPLLLRKLAPEVREPTRLVLDRLAPPETQPHKAGAAKPNHAPVAKDPSAPDKTRRAARPKRPTQTTSKGPGRRVRRAGES